MMRFRHYNEILEDIIKDRKQIEDRNKDHPLAAAGPATIGEILENHNRFFKLANNIVFLFEFREPMQLSRLFPELFNCCKKIISDHCNRAMFEDLYNVEAMIELKEMILETRKGKTGWLIW